LPDAVRGREVLELVGGNMETIWPRLGPSRGALDLDALLDRWIGDCSAGMQQRITIALAFVQGHTWVILDEPFNWVDPVAAFDLRQALRGIVEWSTTD
jgi:ABC-2 type transport system ATP-binding protein